MEPTLIIRQTYRIISITDDIMNLDDEFMKWRCTYSSVAIRLSYAQVDNDYILTDWSITIGCWWYAGDEQGQVTESILSEQTITGSEIRD